MKICTICFKPLDDSEFYRAGKIRLDGSYGLKAHCKECEKRRVKAHYQANKEKYAASRAVWVKKNPDKLKASRLKYAKINPEKIREYCRNYYYRHKEARSEQNRQKAKAWAKANPNKVRERENVDSINLGDRYIRRLLCSRNSLKMSEIPRALVEAKRVQMFIKRELENEKRNRIKR